jgi:hypothetical protein
MVTGVETAGIVLAVLPLLIEALKAYKEGLEKTRLIASLTSKSRRRLTIKIERLILRLGAQRVHFESNLTKLFRLAAPEAELERLPHAFDDPLWSGETGMKIKTYLSRSSPVPFDAFIGTIRLYEGYLKDIAQHLRYISRPRGVS